MSHWRKPIERDEEPESVVRLSFGAVGIMLFIAAVFYIAFCGQEAERENACAMPNHAGWICEGE